MVCENAEPHKQSGHEYDDLLSRNNVRNHKWGRNQFEDDALSHERELDVQLYNGPGRLGLVFHPQGNHFGALQARRSAVAAKCNEFIVADGHPHPLCAGAKDALPRSLSRCNIAGGACWRSVDHPDPSALP
jgi:hypothetical protein